MRKNFFHRYLALFLAAMLCAASVNLRIVSANESGSGVLTADSSTSNQSENSNSTDGAAKEESTGNSDSDNFFDIISGAGNLMGDENDKENSSAGTVETEGTKGTNAGEKTAEVQPEAVLDESYVDNEPDRFVATVEPSYKSVLAAWQKDGISDYTGDDIDLSAAGIAVQGSLTHILDSGASEGYGEKGSGFY